jgi:predicted AlkP superfamily phosphohydrolase/phosphomutase
MKNEILEELWKSKDEVAKEYRYNIDKLVKELRKKEKCVKVAVVDFTPNILATRNN